MADSSAQLGWGDAQWQKVNAAVTEAFDKASVASALLTCYGPLPPGTETVRNEQVSETPDKTVRIDADSEGTTLKLINLTVKVELSNEQVADESLANALLAFRRAANILAQDEDDIVFNGFDPARRGPVVVVNKPSIQEGLAGHRKRRDFRALRDTTGLTVVKAVVGAIRVLEDRSNPAPFACVLGNTLFESVHDPTPALVLPADRIKPLLKGPTQHDERVLLRSGRMDPNTGIVVSLAGSAVDIVVGTPPTVQFLQRTPDAKFLFRVYERFVLRVRDRQNPPVAGFTILPETSAELKTAQKNLKTATSAEHDAPAQTRRADAELRVAEAQARVNDLTAMSGAAAVLAPSLTAEELDRQKQEAQENLRKAQAELANL